MGTRIGRQLVAASGATAIPRFDTTQTSGNQDIVFRAVDAWYAVAAVVLAVGASLILSDFRRSTIDLRETTPRRTMGEHLRSVRPEPWPAR